MDDKKKSTKPASPFQRKTAGSKSTTTTTKSTSHRRENTMAVSTRKSPAKSTAKTGTKTTRRRAASKPVVKQGVILNLVREPAGKGGYRFDNSHDRDEKLDVTTAYVSQKDMKKTGTFTLALVTEPKGKGGVRFANTAKEKLDVTTMYLSQADRKTLGVDDSVTLKLTDDDDGWFVTVTP